MIRKKFPSRAIALGAFLPELKVLKYSDRFKNGIKELKRAFIGCFRSGMDLSLRRCIICRETFNRHIMRTYMYRLRWYLLKTSPFMITN